MDDFHKISIPVFFFVLIYFIEIHIKLGVKLIECLLFASEFGYKSVRINLHNRLNRKVHNSSAILFFVLPVVFIKLSEDWLLRN